MTTTVNFDLDGVPKVIASSGTYTTATIQVRGNQNAEIAVDTRTQAERIAADDAEGIIYKPLEKTQFSGWDGDIIAWAPNANQATRISVILS